MQEKVKNTISRRSFVGVTASTAFAISVVPGKVLGAAAPSGKLNIAVIGVGGRGGSDLILMQAKIVYLLY